MDPNDIYSLAQQAGVIDPNTGDVTSATPSYADYQNSSAPPQPGSGFSDEDILAHFVPPSDEQPPSLFNKGPQLTPPTPPGLSDLQSPAAPLDPGMRVKAGGSASKSGYNDATNNQIAAGPGGRLGKQEAAIEQQGQQEQQQRQQPFVDAANAGKAAVTDEAQATADYATAEGHEKAILATLQQNFDSDTSSIIAKHQAEANTAKAKYVAALNDFRAARVNPAQLWQNMGTGDQVGTLAAAFVQDFLGAKGINISAMSTLNKAIDRNIDSQVRAIQTKGQVADGFKTLWDMQMADSHSAEETRTRMRGFMLDSMKTAIESHLAQFNAALATSKGRVGVAKIDEELAKNIGDVTKQVDAVTAQRISSAVQVYGDNLRASMESARISADKEIAAQNRKAQQGDVNPYANLIPDNSESGGGHMVAEFNDPKNTALNTKYLEQQASADNTLKMIRQYREMQRMHGKNQGMLSGTRWGKAEDQQLKTLATEILGNRLLEKSGKAATDNERKALAIGTPQALFGGDLDIASTLALTENIERQQLDSFRHTVARDLDPNDPRRQLSVGTGSYGETEKKEASSIATGEDKKKDLAQKQLDGQLQDLEAHTAYSDLGTDDVGADVRGEHDKFVKNHPGVMGQTNDVPAGKIRVYFPDGDRLEDASKSDEYRKKGLVVREANSFHNETTPMKFERGLTRLRVDAEKARNDYQEAKTDEDRSEQQHNYEMRIERLKHVASGLVQNPEDKEALFAKDMLDELGVDAGLPLEEPVNESGGFSVHDTVGLPPIPPEAKRK